MDDVRTHIGGCHCGNITLRYSSAIAPADTVVRACQCAFCRKHASLAIADPDGRLEIGVKDQSRLNRYVFGLKTAEFLLCGTCGVYVAAVIDQGGAARALVVVNALEEGRLFSRAPQETRYDAETETERQNRRRAGWTPVVFTTE